MAKPEVCYLYQSLVDENGLSREKTFFDLELARSEAGTRGGQITRLYRTSRSYESREEEVPEFFSGPLTPLLCPCETEIEASCPSDEYCWACYDGLEQARARFRIEPE